MALAIAVDNGFEFEITRSSIYVGGGSLFSFYASVERLRGAPLWSLEKEIAGNGFSVRFGPLFAQACRPLPGPKAQLLEPTSLRP